MHKVFVRYGRKRLFFNIPFSWKVLTYALFPDDNSERDADELTTRGLNNLIESRPLEELVNPEDNVAVLIEDHTRNSPKQDILRILLSRLNDLSIPRDNISVVVALGTHKGLSSKGLSKVYGEDLVRDYSFINHDSSATDLIAIGKLESGTTVKINRKVHEADFRIGIGSIFPHPMNGYGGGGKILFPGVANYEAILEHHLKHGFRNGSQLGHLEGNPFYEEINLLAEAGKLDFIINSILDHNDHLYGVVAGNPFRAHEKGVKECEKIISRTFTRKADITIISSFPYTEGTQVMKPLAPASMITRPGGIIILMARCSSALPEEYMEACEDFRLKHKGHLTSRLFQLFDNNKCVIKNGAPELNMSLAQVLMAQDEFRIIFVTEDIPEIEIERLGFIHAKDMISALEMGSSLVNNPEVHIVPSGGVILPVIEQ
jgi:nickel-dependent lactate racemase